ncbi:MAG TPA: hypothetical protein DCS97_04985 [Planctomycetes bacterium]|nr:hypothetical protein [Planctomycetota bacterium]
MSRLADLLARLAPWLALATALVAATRFFGDAIWPCPVSCQGGGHYQRLFGVPVHIPAVAALVVIAGLAWWRRAWAGYTAWAAAGASLYFLWIAWRLDLTCAYCFTVHAGVLLTAACCLSGGWLGRMMVASLVFLGLHLAFHPGVVVDGPAAPPPAQTPEVGGFFTPRPTATTATIPADLDRLRRQGGELAAYVLEVAVDLHCPHCAASAGPLSTALRDHLAAGRVEVVTRFLTRASAPSGRELAAHVLGAANPVQTDLLIRMLLGTPEGRGWSQVRSRIAELADPAALEARQVERQAGIAALLDGDAQRLRTLKARTTPFAALSHRGSEPFLRWEGAAFDPAAIAREIPAD